jgi:hypothetical protein
MSIFDDVVSGIADAFFQTGANWRERVGDATIKLVSPETSSEFSARWIESQKGADKKLGLFDYPNIQGTIAQDLKSTSNRFSITFRFIDYENHDLQARDFFAIAARESGQWSINHPIYGLLGLQLIAIREGQSSSVGGFTEVSTDWIESIDEDALLTTRELAGLVDGQCSLVQLNSIEQFVNTCDQTSKAFRAAIENTVNGIENVVDFVLSPLFAVEDLVSSAMNTVSFGIQGSLDAVLLPLTELAGQVQNLVNIPLLATRDTKTRITKYATLRSSLETLLPGENVPTAQTPIGGAIVPTWASAREKRNSIVTAELASVSSIVAFSQILLTADDINTRSKALDLSQQLVNAFSDLLTAYDAQQEAQETVPLEDQYFSNSSVYTDLAKLVSLTLEYNQALIGDLRIEKKITLKAPQSAAKLCIEEYGTLDKYDELIASNNLKSSEILWLPAGKEIIIYI